MSDEEKKTKRILNKLYREDNKISIYNNRILFLIVI